MATATDCCPLDYLKSNVYVNKPWTLDELKTNIRQQVAVILTETLAKRWKTMENAAKRALLALQAQDGH